MFEEISLGVQKGQAAQVIELINKALENGVTAKEILENGLLDGMSVVGEKFKNNEIFVPEVLIAARAMAQGTELLRPYLAEAGVEPIGKAVMGTVKGDLHDIGKNLVKMMFEGKGIEVIDLGVNVSAEQFIAAVKQSGATIICCSALLTTTMGEMKNVVELAKSENLRENVTIMVGGAPVNQAYCDSIGADVYTADAASAAEAAKKLLTGE